VVIPPQQERVVSAPEAGLVSQVVAGVGEEVQAGAHLARLESPELIGLQTEYLQAASELRLAQADLQRDERLLRDGIIAERRLLETRSRHEQATARLEERRQVLGLAGLSEAEIEALAASRRLSGGLEVRAPTDGVVLEALVVAGQRVDRAQPLFRLARLAPLWLEVRLPLDRVRGITPGSAVTLPCEGVAARVTLVGQSVDPSNQTVQVRAEVAEPRGCVSPGQFVEVRLELAAAGAQVRVPAAALVRSGEKTVVFAREPFGFTARLVQVAAEQGGYAVVTGAVKAGDSVAVSGLAALKSAWLAAGGAAE
jgi:RND family efflux transporter MFP subunit